MTLNRECCGPEYAFVRLFDSEQLRGQQSQLKSRILSREDKSIEDRQKTSSANLTGQYFKNLQKTSTADWGILNLYLRIN